MKFSLTFLSLLPIINAVPLLTTQEVTMTSLLPTELVSDYTTATETFTTSVDLIFTTQMAEPQITLEIMDTTVATLSTIDGGLTTLSTAILPTTTMTSTEQLPTVTPVGLQINVDALTSVINSILSTETAAPTLETSSLIATATSALGEINPTEVLATATSALGDIIPTGVIGSATSALGGIIPTGTQIAADAVQSATSIIAQLPSNISGLTSLAGGLPVPTSILNGVIGALPTQLPQVPGNDQINAGIQSVESRIGDIVAYLQSQGQNADQVNALIAKIVKDLNL